MTVESIAKLVGGIVDGDGSKVLEQIVPISEAGPNDLTFAIDDKNVAKLKDTKAAAAIIPQDVSAEGLAMGLIKVADVGEAVATLLDKLAPQEDFPPVGVHSSAVISDTADLADNVAIGANVTIGERTRIGPGCVICPNVVIGADVELASDVVLFEGVVVRQNSQIGNRVRIGSNTVIGFEGFGYYTSDGIHYRIPHIGNVVLEDDVEIGACSCVDKGKFGSTRVGAGTKIDNLVQIAHNVQVGKGCLLTGQSGVAGSAKLGNYVVLGGNSGVRDNISIGNGVQCAAHSAIAADVPDGQIVAGTPAMPAREKYRVIKAQEKLPELLKQVKKLEARLEKLESSKDN